MRLTKVVAWNEPLCQSEVSGKAKKSNLRARSPSSTADADVHSVIILSSSTLHGFTK